MNKVFLVSTLNLYEKDDNGNRIALNFGNENNILDNIKKSIKKYDNFLFVASNETNTESTDKYANVTFDSFNLTLPFKNYKILDIRTEDNAKELLEEADLIFLSGGHLPHQNKFFNKIGLADLIKNVSGTIIGGSAGAMNCAKEVYIAPELEGESIDPNFTRFSRGLGLTNISTLPHYNFFEGFVLDNKRYIEEIILPDSYKKELIAIPDGSYITIDENENHILYGIGYLISNGKIEVISKIK